MTGLFDLTTEQLEKLKSEAPTFWAKLDGDVRDYLDKIIEGEERIEEIHNQINEQLTQTTFDGVYSNFIDTLMDMKASSKDAAEDVSEYFMQAMLSEQIGTLYQDKLKKWYEKFAKGMEDGSLTESERNALNSEYMGYIEEAMKLRDELAAATGYDKISQESTSQSASSKGFQAMSQDTGEELNGRFTALQIAGEEIKNQNIIQMTQMEFLLKNEKERKAFEQICVYKKGIHISKLRKIMQLAGEKAIFFESAQELLSFINAMEDKNDNRSN